MNGLYSDFPYHSKNSENLARFPGSCIRSRSLIVLHTYPNIYFMIEEVYLLWLRN